MAVICETVKGFALWEPNKIIGLAILQREH